MLICLAVLYYLYQNWTLSIKSFEKIDKNVKYYFLSFSPTLNARTRTAATNEVFKGLNFKPIGFLVISY